MEEVSELDAPSPDDEIEIELRMGRFEHLMDRRPLLLNSVLLRQNPHNVAEWQKRVDLLEVGPFIVGNGIFGNVLVSRTELTIHWVGGWLAMFVVNQTLK